MKIIPYIVIPLLILLAVAALFNLFARAQCHILGSTVQRGECHPKPAPPASCKGNIPHRKSPEPPRKIIT